MTLKEMEERVNDAKRLQAELEQFKRLLGVISRDDQMPVTLHLTKGMYRHEVSLSWNQNVVSELKKIISNEIAEREEALKIIENEPEEKFFEVYVPKAHHEIYQVSAKNQAEAVDKVINFDEIEKLESYMTSKYFDLCNDEFSDHLFAKEVTGKEEPPNKNITCKE